MIPRLAIVCIVALGLGMRELHAAPVPKGKTFSEKLVGRWEMLTSSGKAPTTPVFIVLRKDMTMTLEWGTGENVRKWQGTYKIEGEAYHYDVKMGTRQKAEKMDVSKLNADEMTMADPDGIVEEFKRVDDVPEAKK